ncbi:MAG TPA: ABC transporter permease [Chloroflexota bacterium]|nr:ABC transporter permease [Chloroflexota bacterium]
MSIRLGEQASESAAVPEESEGVGRRGLLARFLRHRAGVAGAIIVLLLVLVALTAPLFAPYNPDYQDLNAILHAPSHAHVLGTDDLGRDELSRLMFGSRVSLEAAALSVFIAILIGIPLGFIAGYYRGFWDEWIIMRVVDALQAFPFLILALALTVFLGPGLVNASIAIGIGFSPGFVRITRAQVLAVSNQEYVDGARAIGAGDLRIFRSYILPNALAPILVLTALSMAAAVLAEAALSFLGLGVQPPTPSWGQMLSVAQNYITLAPWLAYWPGIAIFLAVIGFNIFGDGIRDTLDPRMQL